jgi:RNA polymerase sigma factor (TIGR02999 family)
VNADSTPDFTRWLNASSGSRDDGIFAGIYVELQRIARGRMAGEREGHTLSATALVHEAWLRLEKSAPDQWRDRKQFYGAAAEAMRRILVEGARRRLTAKRGSGDAVVPLDGLNVSAPLPDERLLCVHEALDQLELEDELKARIVKLHYFSGLTHDEIASLLGVSKKTVSRHWAVAKLWLFRAMQEKS